MDRPLLTSITNYDDARTWIYDRIDYERIRPRRSSNHFRLERVERLLSLINSPQKRIPAVHIAGTKGKGSTAAILHSILTESGIRTGLYTSPHIHLFEERMRVNRSMPSPDQLTELVAELQRLLSEAPPDVVEDGPTYFEVATLLCWMYFDRQQVEIAVLETGLGGRLDCTNVCWPLVTIITTIGLDHTHILGSTLELIAAEKAGIIKPGVPVLSWVSQPEVLDVIQQKAAGCGCELWLGGREIHEQTSQHDGRGRDQQPDTVQHCTISTPLSFHEDLCLPLVGDHQRRNAALAVTAADLLARNDARITPESIALGVERTRWPLRFEVFAGSPPVVLDAAHNPDSMQAFLKTLNQQAAYAGICRILIFASSLDKDALSMLRLAATEFDALIVTQFLSNPRAFSLDVLAGFMDQLQREGSATGRSAAVFKADTPAAALALARSMTSTAAPKAASIRLAQTGRPPLSREHLSSKHLSSEKMVPERNAVICGTGSIFLAAELREILLQELSS